MLLPLFRNNPNWIRISHLVTYRSVVLQDVTVADATVTINPTTTDRTIRIMAKTFCPAAAAVAAATLPSPSITSSGDTAIAPSSENGINAVEVDVVAAGLPVVIPTRAVVDGDPFVALDPLVEEEEVVAAPFTVEIVKIEAGVAEDLQSSWAWTLGHWWIDW